MSPQSDATNFIGHLFDDAAQSDNGAKKMWERSEWYSKTSKKENMFLNMINQ